MNIDCISTVLSHLNINKYEKVVNVLHYREKRQVLRYWKTHTKYEVMVNNYGGKTWFRNGKLHRDGKLPAITWSNGGAEWWKTIPRIKLI